MFNFKQQLNVCLTVRVKTSNVSNSSLYRFDKNGLLSKPDRMCGNTSTCTKPKMTLMITGAIVIATVAFIISLLTIFIHRLIERFKLKNHARNLPDIINV